MKHVYTLFLFCLLFATKAFAQPAGWSYSQPYQITENSGNLVVNYQARLTINTQALIGAGQMNANGDDIRFGKDCAGNVLYNYWIESGINTASTVIWVKIDTLFASSTRTFYMYYGNNSASASSSINIFPGPFSGTDSTSNTSLSGSSDAQRGFRFSPTEDILVTAFGKNEPSSDPHTITLFDFNTQAILAQQSVSGAATQWSYTSLASPLWLTQGTQYLCEIFFPSSSSAYYFGASPTVGQQIQYLDMRYCNGCTANTFPTNSLGGMLYGYVDFWYYTKTNVSPAPTISAGSMLVANAGTNVSICPGTSTTIGGTATGGAGGYSYSWSPAGSLSASNVASPVATPAGSTTYTVMVTDVNGCTASGMVTVSLYPAANVAATTANSTICNGDTATLLATGTSTYNWQPGNVNAFQYDVAPSVSTTYTVVGTDANGCTDTAWVSVTVNPTPTATIVNGHDTICSNVCDTLMATVNGGTGPYAFAWNDNSTAMTSIVCPSSSQCSIVMVQDANGCMATDTFCINVLQAPTIATTGQPAICAGDSTLLSATGSNIASIDWMPTTSLSAATGSQVDAFPSATTTYTVTATASNGCTAWTTQQLTVNPLPTVTYTSSVDTVCSADAAFTLTGGAPAGGTYSGPGVTGSSFSPVGAGNGSQTITYVYTDNNNCSSSATHVIVVDPCTGIFEQASGNTSLFPNPFTTELTIVRASGDAATVEVFDAQGKLVLSKSITGTRTDLETSGLADGAYSIRITGAQGTETFRVVKGK